MPVLTGTLHDVLGEPVPASQVRYASVRAPMPRRSLASVDRLILSSPVTVDTAGTISLELEPGPAVLVIDTYAGGPDTFDLAVTEDMTRISEALAESGPSRSWDESVMVQLRADAIEAAQQARDARDEAVAAALEWRGDWDPEVEYLPQDVVSHEGSSWRALEPSTGVEPVEGDVWSVLAAAGASGATSWGQIADVPDTFPPTEHDHPIGDLDVAGTPDANTFLRGDGRWATPPTGGDGGSTNAADLTGALTDQVDATDAMVTPTDGEPGSLGGVLDGLRADVEGKADDDHTHDISGLETSNEPTPDTFLRGDGSWAVPEGGGNGGGGPANAVLSDTVRNIIVSTSTETPLDEGDLLITTPQPRVIAVAHSPQSYGTGDSVTTATVTVPDAAREGDLVVALVGSSYVASVSGFNEIVTVDSPRERSTTGLGRTTACQMQATSESAGASVTASQTTAGRLFLMVVVLRAEGGVEVEEFGTVSKVTSSSDRDIPVPAIEVAGVGRLAMTAGVFPIATTGGHNSIETSDPRWWFLTPQEADDMPTHQDLRAWVAYRQYRNGDNTASTMRHSSRNNEASGVALVFKPAGQG